MWSRAVFVALGPCMYCVRLNVIFVAMVSLFRRGGAVARHCPYCSPLGGELTFPSSLCLLFFQKEMGQQRLCKSDQQGKCYTTMAWRIVLLERNLHYYSMQIELGQCPWTLSANTRYHKNKKTCTEIRKCSRLSIPNQNKNNWISWNPDNINESRFRVIRFLSTNWNCFSLEAPHSWGICINMKECVKTTIGVFASHNLERQEFNGVAWRHNKDSALSALMLGPWWCQGVFM